MSLYGILADTNKSMTSFENADNSTLISIEFDVTVDETHDWNNDVTSSPVENGSNITDNILEMPEKLRLTGFISNSPISADYFDALAAVGDAAQNLFSDVDDTPVSTIVDTTFGLLHDLKQKRKLMTVYTRYKVYTDMAIVSISIPRQAGLGEALQFTVEFLKIRLVDTQVVDVPPGISAKLDKKAGAPVQKKSQPQKDAGANPVKDLNKSGAASLGDLLSNAAGGLKDQLKVIMGAK